MFRIPKQNAFICCIEFLINMISTHKLFCHFGACAFLQDGRNRIFSFCWVDESKTCKKMKSELNDKYIVENLRVRGSLSLAKLLTSLKTILLFFVWWWKLQIFLSELLFLFHVFIYFVCFALLALCFVYLPNSWNRRTWQATFREAERIKMEMMMDCSIDPYLWWWPYHHGCLLDYIFTKKY